MTSNNQDWVGNRNSIFKILAATNHGSSEREAHDYYATEPRAVELLLEKEKFASSIWEPACGEGHIAKVLHANGYHVVATDLIDRGFGTGGIDFLKTDLREMDFDIVTNPPYKFAKEFVEQALHTIKQGNKVAMLLKLTFLEGQGRRVLFEKHPPEKVYVFSGRVKCAKNGDFDSIGSSAVAYAWFVWRKGFTGDPVIRWVN